MKSLALLKRHKKHDRSGTTTVEFAFVAPVVFLFIWASLECLFFMTLDNLADMAAYRAAREVMVPGATIQEGKDEATRLLGGYAGRQATITVKPYDINNDRQSQIDDYTARIDVVVKVPLKQNLPLMATLLGSNRKISSTTSLSFEGYSGFYDGFSY